MTRLFVKLRQIKMDGEEQMDTGAVGMADTADIFGTLKNFEIEKRIGKGQFSEVWKARCIVDNSVIALKKVQVWWLRVDGKM